MKVLEAGVVGSLDYKIIQASKADDLYEWLKENKYSYCGDEATLDFYIKKAWFFTVMKIDPMQMKKRKDGSYEGEVTPTRFTFASEKLVYPLKITQISVKDKTEALFYVQAAHKVDLPGDFSYEFTWTPMWSQATGFAVPEKLTKEESRMAEARPAARCRTTSRRSTTCAARSTSRPPWNGPRRSPTRTWACSKARRSTTARPPRRTWRS